MDTVQNKEKHEKKIKIKKLWLTILSQDFGISQQKFDVKKRIWCYIFDRITFKRIIKNKSTEQFSGIPYVMTLLNCLLSAWYFLIFFLNIQPLFFLSFIYLLLFLLLESTFMELMPIFWVIHTDGCLRSHLLHLAFL